VFKHRFGLAGRAPWHSAKCRKADGSETAAMLKKAMAAVLAAAVVTIAPALATSAPSATAPASGKHAMVVSDQRHAAAAGVSVLRAGGNAVDAAVAVAYAMAVTESCCGNIGGGGFILVRMHDGRERVIDFREAAPARASRDMYLDARGDVIAGASTKGYKAVAVPGTVLGLERARVEFGTKSRAELMAPAIRLARDGFVLNKGDLIPFAGSIEESYSGLAKLPGNVRDIFAPYDRVLRSGDRLKQPQLARTLELIARDGPRAFYNGPIATAIVAASDANGGLLTLSDFSNYKVFDRVPLHCAYNGYDIIAPPPPSSGGVTLCEILNIVAPLPIGVWPWHGVQEAHYVIEAERRAYADRNEYLGDPAFVSNPVDRLLDPLYAASLRAGIAANSATPSKNVHPGLGNLATEGMQTTHFSVVDAQGNAVAFTYTINDWFGASVIAGDTGFFLNDTMDDFTSKPGVPNMFGLVQDTRNAIAPGKRPLSSMTPTIVTRGGKLVMVTGSPGGSRITTIALETLLNVLDYRMNVQQAVDAPRIHMQWLPDELQYEPGALDATTMASLETMGYAMHRITYWGSAQAIVVDPRTGVRYGGSDRRRPSGAAIGY
jgi:gamma-glutamyltranspeptidase / glutathione hydrolase